MKFRLPIVFALMLAVVVTRAERINHEGRILGALPVVTNAILFNTTNADAVLSAMQIFPVTSAWNENISNRPTLTNSDAMIAQIIADLAPANRTLHAFREMNFVLIPDNQPLIPINFNLYPGDSDPPPYPIPTNTPVETWPSDTGSLTLQQWQQDINNTGGDRHSSIVQPGNGFMWETWLTKYNTNTGWQAANGAKFNLKSNALRTPGWTSGDAAGLPMFPALPRFDECERGVVEHACRIVVGRSRKEYIYPATHYASSTPAGQINVPAMGQRVRLKSSFVIPSNWTKQEKAILTALKKYGALVADNGSFFSISVTPDNRWPAGCFNHFTSIGITNFEVIQTTSATGGPRSGGAPLATAGADATAPIGVPFSLQGFVSYTNPATVIKWKLYSGPTNLTFANASLTNTTVTFNTNGTYTLMLSADDGIHAVAYDAVVINAAVGGPPPILMSSARVGTNFTLSWTSGNAPFVVERTDTLPATTWNGVVTTSQHSVSIPITNASRFFRVRGS